MAEDQDLLNKERRDIQKQKIEIFVEKEKFDKNKRALIIEDLKVIDLRGKEVASQIENMREELRRCKVVSNYFLVTKAPLLPLFCRL